MARPSPSIAAFATRPSRPIGPGAGIGRPTWPALACPKCTAISSVVGPRVRKGRDGPRSCGAPNAELKAAR